MSFTRTNPVTEETDEREEIVKASQKGQRSGRLEEESWTVGILERTIGPVVSLSGCLATLPELPGFPVLAE